MALLRRKKSVVASNDGPSLPSLDIKPTSYPKNEAQGVLIAVRQLPGYPTAIGLLGAAFVARADRILMDFTANATVVRFRVDGVWEANPPLDRPSGDGALVVIKRLFGMNPNERRVRQMGKCGIVSGQGEWVLECTSQGVAAGERVLISIDPKKPTLKTLEDLGMRESMRDQFKAALGSNGGLVLISAPAGNGLPTTWRVALDSADKYTRDWVALEDAADPDPELINVTPHLIERDKGDTPESRLIKMLLKQPDVFVMPRLYSSQVVESLVDQMKNNDKQVVTRLVANDPVEAILTLLSSHRTQAKEVLMLTRVVLSQRLVRRLCDVCRQPFTPSAQMQQKLGIPPGRVSTLYQPFVLPPPDKRVDDKGNPIEPCPKCQGRGYFGRMAIFEMLTVDDNVRKAILQYAKTPDMIRQYLKKSGHLGFQEEGVLAVALGNTSLQELQRVMTAKA